MITRSKLAAKRNLPSCSGASNNNAGEDPVFRKCIHILDVAESIGRVAMEGKMVATWKGAVMVAPDTGFPMGQPLFWVLAVPLTFWAVALGSYGPVSVAIFRGLMIADVPVILIILGCAFAKGAGGVGLFVGAAVVTILLVGIAAFFYSKSALREQGPFR